MRKRIIGVIVTMVFVQLIAARDTAGSRDQIPEKYKWNLSDMYPSNDAWKKDKQTLESMLGKFDSFKGKLGTSADILYNCLQYSSDVWKKYYLLSDYAQRLSDQDTRESVPLSMDQEIRQVGTRIAGTTAFIDPEILSIDKAVIKKFMDEKQELKEFAQYIDNIQRLKEHTLSKEEEAIIAEAGNLTDIPYDVYGIFKNADMPRPILMLEDGKEVRLDDANYTLYRANADRDLRKSVFEKFFGAYKDFERSIGVQLYAELKKDIFYKNVRKYDSCLESALNANNIPTEVYTNLIESIHKNLPTLHRYLNLRKRMLGLDELHYYDMYPSLVGKVDMRYTIEEAQELIKKSLKPLGNDYIATLNKAFNDRWIDMMPNTGKRSGAYSSGGAYDVHPYILLNYQGKYDDVSTLAHELGHTMHSYYSNKNQTYMNAQYPIFLAEVASITNESLLVDHVLKEIKDPDQRLAILGNQLETFRTTLFRQTQFAEFELKIHEKAEKGEALTGEALTKLYLDILKTYYGQDQGVTVIEDLYGIEWAYIPHFYYNFYVFQYATSLCAATAVSEKILKEGKPMQKKYVEKFLSAGGSDYAIPILKNIGVDMTTSEPFDLAIKKMNSIIDEIEQILDKK